jgi:hypothetical protein
MENTVGTKLVIINNTGSDIRFLEPDIRQSLEATGGLPEELWDTFNVHFVQVGYEIRVILNWA